jgi:2-hydroxychromene-2-carboxylate isomerase
MSHKKDAYFYFDIISPFAYFYVKQRHLLEQKLNIKPIPVLLGGLLRSTKNTGPAEIPSKRLHTYKYCVWLAQKLNIPFQFPQHHPFMTVSAQRLLIQADANWPMIEKAFEFIWMEGKDPNLTWAEFCNYLGLPSDTSIPNDDKVKAKLITNTEQAKNKGAFGVPTLAVDDHCFWGVDAMEWTLDYLNRPGMFDEDSFIQASKLPNGLTNT